MQCSPSHSNSKIHNLRIKGKAPMQCNADSASPYSITWQDIRRATVGAAEGPAPTICISMVPRRCQLCDCGGRARPMVKRARRFLYLRKEEWRAHRTCDDDAVMHHRRRRGRRFCFWNDDDEGASQPCWELGREERGKKGGATWRESRGIRERKTENRGGSEEKQEAGWKEIGVPQRGKR